MKIVDARSAPVSPNPHGVYAAMIHDTPDAQAVHITLQPGEALKLHAIPGSIFFVLEERGIVKTSGEQQEVVADTLIENLARIPHRLTNESDSMFRFLAREDAGTE